MVQTQTAGGVVVNSNNKVLVVSQHGSSWSLPKGHIDTGETGREAAIREIEEESGITRLKYVKPLGTYQRHRIGLNGGEDKGELKTITIFLYTTPETNLKPVDPENPEARWVGIDSVVKILTHPKDKDFFESIIGEVKEYISKR